MLTEVRGRETGILWQSTAEADEPASHRFSNGEKVEVAIVGGGFCGLSAALHLAEAGTDCCVVEAQQPGWGASGRNGGQVIAGLKLDPQELRAKFGDEHGEALYRFGAETADLVFELIERFGIPCEPRRVGWIQAARSIPVGAAISARVAEFSKRGAHVELLHPDRLRELTGTGLFRFGMLDHRCGSVQPLGYARGLAAAAAHAGARIFSRTRVMALERDRGLWVLRTQQGALRARTVVLATNAYLEGLWPGLVRAMIPIQSCQVATEPLPDHVGSGILPSGQPVSDLMDLGVYFRRDRDGRFIIGGSGPLGSREAASYFDQLTRAARLMFPALEEVAFPHRWSGKLALTRDHLPRVIRLDDGMIAAYGCNGRGVALATAMGRLAAQLCRGSDNPHLPICTLPPAVYPFYALRIPAMAAVRSARFLRRRFARG